MIIKQFQQALGHKPSVGPFFEHLAGAWNEVIPNHSVVPSPRMDGLGETLSTLCRADHVMTIRLLPEASVGAQGREQARKTGISKQLTWLATGD